MCSAALTSDDVGLLDTPLAAMDDGLATPLLSQKALGALGRLALGAVARSRSLSPGLNNFPAAGWNGNDVGFAITQHDSTLYPGGCRLS